MHFLCLKINNATIFTHIKVEQRKCSVELKNQSTELQGSRKIISLNHSKLPTFLLWEMLRLEKSLNNEAGKFS